MARPDGIGMSRGPQRSLLSLLRESGDALEAASPPFDTPATAARLYEEAGRRGLLHQHGGMPEDDLRVTDAEMEEEAPPFDVEAGTVRLREAAGSRGLLDSDASENSAEHTARHFPAGEASPLAEGSAPKPDTRRSLPGRSVRYRVIWLVCDQCGTKMAMLLYDEGDLPLCASCQGGLKIEPAVVS